MLSHARIWSAIDRLAERNNLTASGLARQAGLDPTTFNKSKRTSADGRLRWPSTESIAKVLDATQTQIEAFLSLVEGEVARRAPRQRPLTAKALPARGGFFDGEGDLAGHAWNDAPLSDGSGVFAIEVSGDSMLPLYRKGDRLLVARDAPVKRGDRVVVRRSSGEIVARTFQKKTLRRVELGSFNPRHKPIAIAVADIDWMARILWASQ